jgi:hypothetical protein
MGKGSEETKPTQVQKEAESFTIFHLDAGFANASKGAGSTRLRASLVVVTATRFNLRLRLFILPFPAFNAAVVV